MSGNKKMKPNNDEGPVKKIPAPIMARIQLMSERSYPGYIAAGNIVAFELCEAANKVAFALAQSDGYDMGRAIAAMDAIRQAEHLAVDALKLGVIANPKKE